jgi:hypothetical protein
MDREEQYADRRSHHAAQEHDAAAERHTHESAPKRKVPRSSAERGDSAALRVNRKQESISSNRSSKVDAPAAIADMVVGEFVSVVQHKSLPLLKQVDVHSDAFSKAFGACIDAFRQAYLRETLSSGPSRAATGIAIEEPDLPEGPPDGKTWAKDRKDGETPADFLRRVYGDWLNRGMTKRQLRQRDPSLVILLNAWLKGRQKPAFLVGKLPSKREQYDRLVGAYEARHIETNPDQVRRFSDAIRRRKKAELG